MIQKRRKVIINFSQMQIFLRKNALFLRFLCIFLRFYANFVKNCGTFSHFYRNKLRKRCARATRTRNFVAALIRYSPPGGSGGGQKSDHGDRPHGNERKERGAREEERSDDDGVGVSC